MRRRRRRESQITSQQGFLNFFIPTGWLVKTDSERSSVMINSVLKNKANFYSGV